MTLTAKDVAQITRLLEESSFDELTLELDGLKLTLRRQGAAPSAPPPPAPARAPVPPVRAPQSDAPDTGREAAPAPAPERTGLSADAGAREVSAPLLGTFYRSPKPGAPPFVEIGSLVEEDTIIGIIEVMKLMNTVRAGVRGRVLEIPAKDGALVEYGETLMRVSEAARE